MLVYILSAQGSWVHHPLHSCTLRGWPGSVLATSLYKASAYVDYPVTCRSITDVSELSEETYDAECPYLFPRGGQCEKAEACSDHISKPLVSWERAVTINHP